jgi:hypothetical protein
MKLDSMPNSDLCRNNKAEELLNKKAKLYFCCCCFCCGICSVMKRFSNEIYFVVFLLTLSIIEQDSI